MPITIPDDWRDAGVSVTCGYETTGDPYEMAAGDFDGMGISCGCLQWNIGMGSLQPMVLGVGEAAVRAAMPTLGARMWQACTSSVATGLAIVRGWQSPTKKLLSVPRAELRALMGSGPMRAQQDLKIDAVARRAMDMAETWARDRDNTTPDKRLYCWFFDLATQNGGLKGLTPKAVADFIKVNRPDRVDDLVCDFLAGIPGSKGHIADAHNNAGLWRNAAGGNKLELLCLAYLRSGLSNPKWRHVVMNRKGSIAMGDGWVNGGRRRLAGFGL